jgi:predicted TIM-barrel fold metal-dependent hydrolase
MKASFRSERDQVALEILSAPTPIYARADRNTASFCTIAANRSSRIQAGKGTPAQVATSAQINEFQAEVASQHPARFRSFIHLPIHELEAMRIELQRWKDHPMTAGIVLGSNVGGIYPADASLRPAWEEIAATRLAVFIHPLTPCGRLEVGFVRAVIFAPTRQPMR